MAFHYSTRCLCTSFCHGKYSSSISSSDRPLPWHSHSGSYSHFRCPSVIRFAHEITRPDPFLILGQVMSCVKSVMDGKLESRKERIKEDGVKFRKIMQEYYKIGRKEEKQNWNELLKNGKVSYIITHGNTTLRDYSSGVRPLRSTFHSLFTLIQTKGDTDRLLHEY